MNEAIVLTVRAFHGVQCVIVCVCVRVRVHAHMCVHVHARLGGWRLRQTGKRSSFHLMKLAALL